MTASWEGLDQTLDLLGRLPGDLQAAADEELVRFVSDQVGRVKARAGRVGRQQALAARSVRPEDRTLVGAAGSGTPAAIFYGAEFGGQRRSTTRQFKPFRGDQGYFMFPQVRDDEGRLIEAGFLAADEIQQEWG